MQLSLKVKLCSIFAPFKLIYSNFSQLLKIQFENNETLKLDKSKKVNDVHPLNILSIYSALDVLILDKFKEVNDVHPENILSILITLDVLKLVKFKEVNDVHPKNIYPISSTLDVSK